MIFFLINLVFKNFLIHFELIIPGLKIFGFPVKSTTVDSIPIFDFPPLIIFIFFLNSSNTSLHLQDLNQMKYLHLALLEGKFKNLSIDLITL